MSSSSLPGDREQSVSGIDPVAAQIEAEIADHLATSAEQLAAAGLAPAEARQHTQQKFGDVAAIGRRCWWIKQGDSLMFRGAIIGLIVVLCIALAATTIGSWQSQTRMADQMAALSEQLKALAERPAPAPAVPAPLEVKGMLYVSSPDQPAAGAEDYVSRVEDGEVIRRVTADQRGEYRTGPLTAGDYTLQANVQQPEPEGTTWIRPRGIQTAPIYVYPGLANPQVDLDVDWHFGRLQIETSRPLPKLEVDGKYTIESRLFVKVSTKYRRSHTWTIAYSTPVVWPAYVDRMRAPRELQDGKVGTSFYELLSNEDLSQPGGTLFFSPRGELPEGQATVVAAVLTDVFPVGYELKPISFAGGEAAGPGDVGTRNAWSRAAETAMLAGGPDSLREASAEDPNDDFAWATRIRGRTWLEHLRGGPQPSSPPRPDWHPVYVRGDLPAGTLVSIARGQVTKVRVEISPDIETRIRELVESKSDPDQFEAALAAVPPPFSRPGEPPSLESPFLTLAKVSVVGTQPLPPSEVEPATGDLPQ
jgi:hypothetical protein